MHRLSRGLFCPVQHYLAQARALLQENTTTENVAAVALALQAKDKDNEKESNASTLVQHYFAQARALLQVNTTTEDVAAVALALQAKDIEKELALKDKDNEKVLLIKKKELELLAKDSEKELLMQHFAPVYNRRAVEELTMYLAKLHPDCSVRNQKEQLVISATIRKLRRKLATCTNAKALRGASTIYKTLSTDLRNMPLPMSIESARWTGLRANERAFMEGTYTKLQRFGLIRFPKD
jgi:hypothetical protein